MLARLILRTLAAARPLRLPLPRLLRPTPPLYGFAVVKRAEAGEEEEMGSLYEDEKESWSADFSAVIADYPFHHIPVTVIRHP